MSKSTFSQFFTTEDNQPIVEIPTGKIDILNGDVFNMLPFLPDNHFHTVVTSPPYYGLRDYNTATWEGGDPECDHVEKVNAHGGERADRDQTGNIFKFRKVCGKCGASSVDRQIGLEDTPEQYVAKMVELFQEVKRVLRDDGTVWLNIGDSYYNYRPGGHEVKQTFAKTAQDNPVSPSKRTKRFDGIKEKDLIGIPWMLAFALRADGWYLRQDIIWHKPNPMPESVKDRCTKAHEYIFLLSKSEKYYFDYEAIKEEGVIPAGTKGAKGSAERVAEKGVNSRPPEYKIYDGKRQKRSVWTVNTKPFAGAHFATFPKELITPCILAGAPVGGNVLEPFGGSGTTGVVAANLGRNATLIELNPEYVKIAEERIKNEVK